MIGTYILSGNGVETYEAHFTYYGFQFVQMEGYPTVPSRDTLQCYFVHTGIVNPHPVGL